MAFCWLRQDFGDIESHHTKTSPKSCLLNILTYNIMKLLVCPNKVFQLHIHANSHLKHSDPKHISPNFKKNFRISWRSNKIIANGNTSTQDFLNGRWMVILYFARFIFVSLTYYMAISNDIIKLLAFVPPQSFTVGKK